MKILVYFFAARWCQQLAPQFLSAQNSRGWPVWPRQACPCCQLQTVPFTEPQHYINHRYKQIVYLYQETIRLLYTGAWILFLLLCRIKVTLCFEKSNPLARTQALLQQPFVCCLVAKLYLTLCDPMDYSSPGSSVLGILPVRILEWAVISFSKISTKESNLGLLHFRWIPYQQILLTIYQSILWQHFLKDYFTYFIHEINQKSY